MAPCSFPIEGCLSWHKGPMAGYLGCVLSTGFAYALRGTGSLDLTTMPRSVQAPGPVSCTELSGTAAELCDSAVFAGYRRKRPMMVAERTPGRA